MYSGTRSLRLISNDSHMKPLTKQDWELEEIPRDLQSFLLPITSRQKSYIIAVCELAQIGPSPAPSQSQEAKLKINLQLAIWYPRSPTNRKIHGK